jgi:hypothetical protein
MKPMPPEYFNNLRELYKRSEDPQTSDIISEDQRRQQEIDALMLQESKQFFEVSHICYGKKLVARMPQKLIKPIIMNNHPTPPTTQSLSACTSEQELIDLLHAYTKNKAASTFAVFSDGVFIQRQIHVRKGKKRKVTREGCADIPYKLIK